MQNRKRDKNIQNRLLDSVGEGKGGIFWKNSIETSILSGWNRSPAQIGCMRQVLRAGALGRPRGMGWGGRWEGGSGWWTHVNPWLIHVNLWQKTLQYCKGISLQLIKKMEKEIKWTGISEFNSDDHYIYNCGQESLRRNGVAIMVNRSPMQYLDAISKTTE